MRHADCGEHFWPDEVRAPAGIAPEKRADTVRPQELAMAKSLMDTLSEGFDLEQLHDDYQATIQAMIDAKLAGGQVKAAAAPVPDNVLDLTKLLERSIKATQGAHRPDDQPSKPGPAKKTKARKTAAAKLAAGKTTAKKTASKSTARPRKAG